MSGICDYSNSDVLFVQAFGIGVLKQAILQTVAGVYSRVSHPLQPHLVLLTPVVQANPR